jgi:hypothetical protein
MRLHQARNVEGITGAFEEAVCGAVLIMQMSSNQSRVCFTWIFEPNK